MTQHQLLSLSGTPLLSTQLPLSSGTLALRSPQHWRVSLFAKMGSSMQKACSIPRILMGGMPGFRGLAVSGELSKVWPLWCVCCQTCAVLTIELTGCDPLNLSPRRTMSDNQGKKSLGEASSSAGRPWKPIDSGDPNDKAVCLVSFLVVD